MDQPREKESQFAALAIRSAYSQALETLFALLLAAVQAPYCIHAWVDLYKPSELKTLVEKIENGKPIHNLLSSKSVTWQTIAEAIFASFVLENKEKEAAIKKEFGDFWSKCASQFLDTSFSKEYNCIKHGLRVRPGGFSFALGVENQPGVPASMGKMLLLGKSEFGSQYLASNKIGENNQHLEMIRHYSNWSPEDLCWGLHLVSLSITNVKAALQILNGIPATKVNFQTLTDQDVFQEPWIRTKQIGFTSMSRSQIDILPAFINPFSKDEILARYQEGKDSGVKHLDFINGDDPNSSNQENTG